MNSEIDDRYSLNRHVEKIVELMKNSKNTVVLTGAGMSTASNIPDFRSENGLYSKYPSNILSRTSFYKNPNLFYEAFNEKFASIIKATPNAGHKIIAKWQNEGFAGKIFTQNIDFLHSQSILDLDISEDEKEVLLKKIFEMHGTIKTFTLKRKGKPYKIKLDDILTKDGIIDYRRNFEGCNQTYYIKPDVVLFEEPVRHFNVASWEVSTKADLLLILGTSMEVYPFNTIPSYLEKSKYVVIINNSLIHVNNQNKIMIKEDIVKSLTLINDLLHK